MQPTDHALFVGTRVSSGLEAPGTGVDRCADISAITTCHPEYRLIVWTPPLHHFDRCVVAITKALAWSGRLLVVCPNRLSLFRGRYSLRALVTPGLHTFEGYRRALVRCGMRVDESWIPWPQLDDAEEYLAPDESHEVRMSAGLRKSVAARLRTDFQDGRVILASRADVSALRGMGGRMAEAVAEFMNIQGVPRVTRFDLRERGALVVMLKGPAERQDWVGRGCVHADVASHLEANERIVTQLRTAAATSAMTLRYIPRPLGRLLIDDAFIWLEDRLPGTVAWRLPLRLRPVIDEDWVEFLRELIRVTCTPVVLDDQAAKELVER